MPQFEYRVVPAPNRGEKARGVKTTADRYALTLSNMMNALGRDGWEYQRADALPCDERVGLTGRKTTFQHMLIFRRPLTEVSSLPAPDEPMFPRLGPAGAAAEGAAPVVGPALVVPPPAAVPAQPGLAAE
jgi:hypothetical protein